MLRPSAILRSIAVAAAAALCLSAPASAGGAAPPPDGEQGLRLIPRPASVHLREGRFELDDETVVAFDHDDPRAASAAGFLAERLRSGTRLPIGELQVSARQGVMMLDNEGQEGNYIGLILLNDRSFGSEGYRLVVNEGNAMIGANTAAGLLYGATTLLQLLPPEVFDATGRAGRGVDWTIPCVSITDGPRFPWRGMHLDVGRHFFPKEFVKKYIDLLALHKMNVFHWHLTEDQGWRIEIRRYPRLTGVGAWRNGSMVGPYSAMTFDSVRYGGYYTQDDIREVVAHAARRNVTIVPEIELPGHSLAALAAHPELSCTGGPFEVGRAWGVYEDVFCPKETTFTFLENVLSEVCELFPGEYVHVGGDEVPKARWKSCDSCQARIRSLGLAGEEGLQGWFVGRIGKFLGSKGKKLIGWDEILEGGLAPGAAVMSWRGTEGGTAAARQGHNAVMSPGSHCYFDYYQGDPKFEPLAIGGFTTVEKVYSYEPVPAELSPAEAGFILGAQGNLWTEYIADERHAEYMALPRMAALSEVVWSPAAGRSWEEFRGRLLRHFAVLERLDVNYSKSVYQLKASARPAGAGILYELTAPLDGGTIRYTTDGSAPGPSSPEYRAPIPVGRSGTVRAAWFGDGGMEGPPIEQRFVVSLSTGKPVTLKTPPHPNYPGNGASTLADGIRGDSARHGKDWIGFWGPDLDAVIDLGKPHGVSSVALGVFDGEGSWIHLPKSIEVSLSDDGVEFTPAGTLDSAAIRAAGIVRRISFAARQARYVKVFAANAGTIPPGKQGAGNDAWLFVDEIVVE